MNEYQPKHAAPACRQNPTPWTVARRYQPRHAGVTATRYTGHGINHGDYRADINLGGGAR